MTHDLSASTEQTIIDLQIKLMEQERATETLSQQLLLHGDRVDKLNRHVQILEAKLAERDDPSSPEPKLASIEEQRPPHY